MPNFYFEMRPEYKPLQDRYAEVETAILAALKTKGCSIQDGTGRGITIDGVFIHACLNKLNTTTRHRICIYFKIHGRYGVRCFKEKKKLEGNLDADDIADALISIVATKKASDATENKREAQQDIIHEKLMATCRAAGIDKPDYLDYNNQGVMLRINRRITEEEVVQVVKFLKQMNWT